MLNIIDVAGNLQLTQIAIEKFAKDNPEAHLAAELLARALAGASGQDQERSSRPTASTSTSC